MLSRLPLLLDHCGAFVTILVHYYTSPGSPHVQVNFIYIYSQTDPAQALDPPIISTSVCSEAKSSLLSTCKVLV